MIYYVGLTNDLARARRRHGMPWDWDFTGPFETEAEARAWLRAEIVKAHVQTGPVLKGWRFGYWYTVTPMTKQPKPWASPRLGLDGRWRRS